MRHATMTAFAALATLLGACSNDRPLPVIAEPADVTQCAFIGWTIGDARNSKDNTPLARPEREVLARKRAAALGATHVIWDTSGRYKGDVVAAKAYRCQSM